VTPYEIAWLVVLGAALVGTLVLFFVTRRLEPGTLRNLLRWLPGALLIVPAGLPGHDGNYAPAFVVAIFEWLFQSDGRPGAALRILLLTLALMLVLILVGQRFLTRRPASAAKGS